MTSKHTHPNDLTQDQIQLQHPRKTLWHISSNWDNKTFITDIDIKNFKQLMQIRNKTMCIPFLNNVVVCFPLKNNVVDPSVKEHTNEIIIITSQNQYFKKKITSSDNILTDLQIYKTFKHFINWVKKKMCIEIDDEMKTKMSLICNYLYIISLCFIEIHIPLDKSITIENKLSLIENNIEKFKKSFDQDLLKINKFIEDNPCMKNPELLDCPLSQFKKRISHIIKGPVGYSKRLRTPENKKRGIDLDDSSSNKQPRH
jgi:hypothetical protein